MLHSSGITASRFFFFLLCSNLVNASRIVKLIFNRSFTCSSLLSCRLVFSFAYTCSCLELVLKIFWMLYSFLAWLKESYCTLLLHLAKCQSLLWGAYWKGNRQQAQVTARQFQTDTMKKKNLHSDSHQTVEQTAQTGCRVSILSIWALINLM